MLPAILGIAALVLGIVLLASGKNNKMSLKLTKGFPGQENPSQRLSSTVRGFLLILCLVVIFATLVYYFG